MCSERFCSPAEPSVDTVDLLAGKSDRGRFAKTGRPIHWRGQGRENEKKKFFFLANSSLKKCSEKA